MSTRATTDGWTSFSLKSLMFVVTGIAVWLALPRIMKSWLYSVVWSLIPGVLLSFVLYGNERQRRFCAGCLGTFAYRAMSSERGWNDNVSLFFTVVAMLAAGVLSQWLLTRLSDEANPQRRVPKPPPPPPAREVDRDAQI